MPYKLSASLHAHSSDVRAVISPTDALVLSASRDKTAVSWTRGSSSTKFAPETVFQAGSKYVNAVTYIPSSPGAPRGYLVAGGNDTVINVYPLDGSSDNPKYSLIGHSENVCALDASPSGVIISGSWDRTAKVWRNFQEAYELRGHEQSVWAVQIVDEAEEIYLTASADKTIKLWKTHKTLRTYSGHNGAVRGLALIPDIGFASCSNDGEIRVWTTDGDIVYTLSGHTSFVYSLSVLPNGDIASGGEDRTVRVWREEECVQTIVIPATSVWAVSSMPNGDIVAGSSDGVIRIFSSAEDRWAPGDELKQYDDAVASQALPAQQIGDVKKTDLPGPEALSSPGRKAGEVKMIRNGDKVEAHQWDSASLSWQKIGDVVDAVGSGRKQLHEGKEYDYVFDVDIQDGVPPLKLSYNANENPYTAAQRFLAANELPMSYLDQVVQFIEKNTSGVNLSAGNELVDPFTGSSRYQASSNSVPTRGAGAFSDPLTGGRRYVPQDTSSVSASSSSFADPFTGGTRYAPPATFTPPPPVLPSPVASPPSIIPVHTFLSFKQANVAAMRRKVQELDDAFRNEISTTTIAMYSPELMKIDQIFTYLTQAVANLNAVTAPPPDKTHVETIVQILERWPPSPRFPIIDLARLITGYCPFAFTDPAIASQFFPSLLKAAEWDLPWEPPLPKHRETNVLLALRTIANAFNEDMPSGAGTWVADILSMIGKAPYEALIKNHRVTLATLLFNLSCVRLKGSVGDVLNTAHLDLLSSVTRQERSDAETAYRTLVALGNTLCALKAQNGRLDPSQSLQFQKDLAIMKSTFPEDRINTVVKDIQNLL